MPTGTCNEKYIYSTVGNVQVTGTKKPYKKVTGTVNDLNHLNAAPALGTDLRHGSDSSPLSYTPHRSSAKFKNKYRYLHIRGSRFFKKV
jgi:hypothetical protein